LRFRCDYDGPAAFANTKEVTLREINRLELDFGQPISIAELHNELTIWQTFFTLALRQAVYLDDARFSIADKAKGTTPFGLMVPGRRDPASIARQNHDYILFTKGQLGNRLAGCLRSWRENYEGLMNAMLLFAGTSYQSDSYIHARLLAYLQALEVLHRERFTASRDLTLVGRLSELFESYPKSLTPIFPAGLGDMGLLKDVRNYLTHYSRPKSLGSDILWSRRLLILFEKTRLFAEVCLLGVMGLSDDEIREHLRTFEPYVGWSHEKHR
jgi:hypothetical protein